MKRRLIIDTDAKNEADDQFAIVHALLSPPLTIDGIVPAHFGDRRSAHSMQDSRDEVDLLLGYLGMSESVAVANGAPAAMSDPAVPVDSPGARMIVEAAHAGGGPLFVAFLGPLTDMASALLLDPSIADTDLTVVWIGGTPYDGRIGEDRFGEFNLSNDVIAANVVFGSALRVWQIPMSVYKLVSVGYAELDEKMAPHGPLGEYLVRQLKEFNSATVDPEIEFRSLGDSPAISVVLNPQGAVWTSRPAPVFAADATMTDTTVEGRAIRVCESVDVRYLLEDMFAKIKRFASDSHQRRS